VGLLLTAALLAGTPLPARADSATNLTRQARVAWAAGERDRAVELATRAVAAAPDDPRVYLFRGGMYEALGRYGEAVADYSGCLKRDPKNPDACDARGSAEFKRGRVKESVADYRRAIELRPEERAGHWRLGISLYYAGEYAAGRDQFAGYEKVDTNDVENAVWHYLCAARLDGSEKARAGMPKIGRDPRVPMMTVYDLYRGAAKPADVLAAAESGEAPAAERGRRRFYAHLYLGLYYDVTGDRQRALDHLTRAAEKYPIEHYMADVARVHRDLLRKAAGAK
jgi:lipoprotein NlpI